MAKWSVALFGHNKPRYELREIEFIYHVPVVGHGYYGEAFFYKASSFTEVGRGYAGTGYHELTSSLVEAASLLIQKTVSRHVDVPTNFDDKKYFIYNVLGWEQRAQPGDIISFKSDGQIWTLTEQKEFLTVTLDNLEKSQMEALCEELWDITDYPTMDNEGIDEQKELYPLSHLKKRRFNLPVNDLKNLGIDETQMLDKEIVYSPNIRDIDKLEAFDKLNDRYVSPEDQLQLIKPVIVKPQGVI